MKSVLKYTEYRQYLEDYKHSTGLSYDKLALSFGFYGNSFLVEIIQAKKNLSLSRASKIFTVLEFTPEEVMHFLLLMVTNDFGWGEK